MRLKAKKPWLKALAKNGDEVAVALLLPPLNPNLAAIGIYANHVNDSDSSHVLLK